MISRIKPVKIDASHGKLVLVETPAMCLRVAAVCSVLGLLVALGVRSSSGQEAKSKSDDEFFTKQVKPILETNCFQCHSHAMKKAKGNLVVDARASLLKGGDSGPAIVPGHPEKSLLIKAIS